MRRHITKLLTVLALFCMTASLARGAPPKKARKKKKPQAPGMIIERVVAVVNDTIVLESELAGRARPIFNQLREVTDPRERERQLRTLLRKALNGMVDEELVLQAAKDAKIEVKKAEVDRAVGDVRRQNKLSEKQFADALKAQESSLKEYRKDVRLQLIRLRAINIIVGPRIRVTDRQVRERYDQMIGQAAAVTKVKVNHILLTLAANAAPEARAEVRRLAGDLVSRARGGESFAALAKAHSQDLGTKDNGGKLGWFTHGELASDWEDILFAMSEGEVRGPVKGPKGLHIFQVAKTKSDATRPFDDVKKQMRRQLEMESRDKHTTAWLEELRDKAHVEIKL